MNITNTIYQMSSPTVLFIEEPRGKRDLKDRTRRFALDCIRVVGLLPPAQLSGVIGKQLLRSSTSVGANYRAAQLAQSKAAFRAKISIVLEEADECVYWIDLIQETGLLPASQTSSVFQEAQELTRILAAIRKKV